MRKPLALCLTLALLCTTLCGCTLGQGAISDSSQPTVSTGDGPTLRLGVYLPQDDAVAEAVYQGASYALTQRPTVEVDGVTYWVELDWPNRSDAASLADSLTDGHCVAAFGGLDSAACGAGAASFQDTSTPLLTLAADDRKITEKHSTLFSCAPSAQEQGITLAKWALTQELTHAAVLTCVTDTYTNDIAVGFTKTFEKTGQVITQTVPSEQTDFTALLKTLKKANVQVVCAPLELEQGIDLLNQAGAMGLDVQWLSGDRWSREELIQQTGANCEGVVLPTAYVSGRNQAFETWAEPHLSSQGVWAAAALGYDCCELLLDAIEGANTLDKPAVIQALKQTEHQDSLCDTQAFDYRGDLTWNTLGLVTVKQGAFHLM